MGEKKAGEKAGEKKVGEKAFCNSVWLLVREQLEERRGGEK